MTRRLTALAVPYARPSKKDAAQVDGQDGSGTTLEAPTHAADASRLGITHGETDAKSEIDGAVSRGLIVSFALETKVAGLLSPGLCATPAVGPIAPDEASMGRLPVRLAEGLAFAANPIRLLTGCHVGNGPKIVIFTAIGRQEALSVSVGLSGHGIQKIFGCNAVGV